MIPRNKALCNVCCHITDEFLFYDSNKKAVIHYDPEQHTVAFFDHAPSESLSLVAPERKDPIPQSITIRYQEKDDAVTLTDRICPHCWKEHSTLSFLPAWSGQHKCYVIGLVGAVSAGKTGWMQSATFAHSFIRYMKSILKPFDDASLHASATRMPPTQKDKYDIRDFEVLDERGRTRCILRIIDSYGEPWMPASNLPLPPYLACADAIHYILDGSLSEPVNNLKFSISNIKNKSQNNRLRIAVSFAKSDKLWQRVKRQDPTLFCKDTADNPIPILNESSLCFQQPPVNESLQRFALRMSLNRYIIQKLHHMLELGTLSEEEHLGNVGYFILSNGTEVDEKNFDYSKQRCVYDPLIWMLYSLGLYDFPEEDRA